MNDAAKRKCKPSTATKPRYKARDPFKLQGKERTSKEEGLDRYLGPVVENERKEFPVHRSLAATRCLSGKGAKKKFMPDKCN